MSPHSGEGPPPPLAPEPAQSDDATNILLVLGGAQELQSGLLDGEEAAGVSVKVLVLSQNKILQQILDDKVEDRVQQRFEEQNLERPALFLWKSGVGGGALLRCEHVARAVSIGNMELFLELLFWHTLALVLATVYGGFRKNFLRFSA